jgi:hypothetical protein
MPSKVIETNPAKTPLEKMRADLAVAVGVTAKDGFVVGRGDVVGVITASVLARRRTQAAVTGTAFATNSPTGTVDDGTRFVIGDVLKNTAGTTVGTILNIVGNTITLAANAAVAVATGANVFGSDGSQTAKAIADEGSDGDGDTSIRVLIGGYLDESLINGLDSTAKTDLGGISAVGGIFKF